MHDVRGLVSLLADGLRGQVRRIGLEQQRLVGGDARRLLEVGIAIGERTAEAQREAESGGAAGLGGVAGEDELNPDLCIAQNFLRCL